MLLINFELIPIKFGFFMNLFILGMDNFEKLLAGAHFVVSIIIILLLLLLLLI